MSSPASYSRRKGGGNGERRDMVGAADIAANARLVVVIVSLMPDSYHPVKGRPFRPRPPPH
jgi:hypothetical protein